MKAHRETAAEWVARWRAIGPVLERERAVEFATADLGAAMAAFDGAWRRSLHTHPPSADSGLVEQQRLFRRWRHA